MRGIYIGNIDFCKDIYNNEAVSVAGNSFQNGLVGSLVKLCPFDVISSIPRKAFSGKKDDVLFEKGYVELYEWGSVRQCGFLNFPIVKQIWMKYAIKKSIRALMHTYPEEKLFIIVYNTFSYKMNGISKAIKGKNIEVFPLIADVPTQEARKSIVQKIEDSLELKYIKKYPHLITLTKYTANELGNTNSFVVVEGGCNTNTESYDSNTACSKTIMFTGTLNMYSGIELILQAMEIVENIAPEITLHIYGDGPQREMVYSKAMSMKNVTYHGRVPHDEVLAEQRKAGLLICPRYPDDFVTRYTFPSKVMEYICAGKPVLCNCLAGIPEEYSDLITIVAEARPQMWAESIVDIFQNYSVYIEKASRAKQYVLKNKNWDAQAKKIMTYIRGIIDD